MFWFKFDLLWLCARWLHLYRKACKSVTTSFVWAWALYRKVCATSTLSTTCLELPLVQSTVTGIRSLLTQYPVRGVFIDISAKPADKQQNFLTSFRLIKSTGSGTLGWRLRSITLPNRLSVFQSCTDSLGLKEMLTVNTLYFYENKNIKNVTRM